MQASARKILPSSEPAGNSYLIRNAGFLSLFLLLQTTIVPLQCKVRIRRLFAMHDERWRVRLLPDLSDGSRAAVSLSAARYPVLQFGI